MSLATTSAPVIPSTPTINVVNRPAYRPNRRPPQFYSSGYWNRPWYQPPQEKIVVIQPSSYDQNQPQGNAAYNDHLWKIAIAALVVLILVILLAKRKM